MRTLLFICIFVWSESLWAEYRVYTLRISNEALETERFVTSTLDHIQYPGYYPLARNEQIELWDTWMCYGRTDHFKDYCENPNAELYDP